jgi:hypothetical protein
MKICPQCQTAYSDDTLQFCLQDGAPLTVQTPSNNWTNAETLVSPEQISEQSQITRISARQPETKKPNTALTVLLTAFAMLLIFGIIGAAAWMYLKNEKKEIAQNTNKPLFANSNETANTGYLADNTNKFPSPVTSAKPTPQTTAAPTPDFNPEQVKTEVSSKVYSWKSALESGNLNALMASYAARLDYYFNKGAIGASAVRADKQRAFSLFDSFSVTLSNMRVSVDETGERATAVFDKEWLFTGAKTNSGKVQSQLQLTKISGEWRITGEKDLKVYYVNK